MFLSNWTRLKELLVTTAVGWIPKLALGDVLRRLLYRTILARLGRSVYFQEGVQLVGACRIEIEDEVHLFRGVRINAHSQNTRICLRTNVSLERGVEVLGGENCHIEIGDRTYVGIYTMIGGPGHVKIGKDCLIAAHSGIIANNHKFADLTRKIREQGVTRKGIVIEDDCWLGLGVKVLDGVTVGYGSVVGAGAVVTKSIPPYSVAVGVPARVIASRKTSDLTPTRNQGATETSHLSIPLSGTLIKVEKTAELIRDRLAANDTLPVQLLAETLIHVLLDGIRQALAADTITILLKTAPQQQLAVCATLGLEEEVEEGIRIPVGRGFAGNIAASNEPLIVEDLSTVEVVSPVLRDKGIRSMVGVPLLAEKQVIGVFHIGTFRSRQFTRTDAQRLQLIGDRLGPSVKTLLGLWKPAY